MTKFLALSLVIIFSSACIKTADQVHREKRFDSMSEQMKDSQGLMADLMVQIKEMRKQVDQLNGRLDEIEHQQGKINPENLKTMEENMALIKTQQETESTQLAQIQSELKDQRAFLEKVTAALKETSTKSSKKKSAKEELNNGLDLIKKDKYADARNELAPLIDHPKLTPGDHNKVLHGLGKVEYYTGNNEKALVYFSKIFTKYPKSSLAPSSLLFIGRSLKKMGKKDEAKEAFAKVVEDYPSSKEANAAKKEL